MDRPRSDRPRIGVDFDNTIVCYDEVFHRVATARGLIPAGLPAGKQAVRDHLRLAGREKEWTRLQGLVYGEFMPQARAFSGALDFFHACRGLGFPICIISHRTLQPYDGPPFDLHAAARSWLDCQGFFDPAGIGLSPSRAIFELSKEEKLGRIALEKCDIFIDDLPEFLLAPGFPAGVTRLLFDPQDRHAAAEGLQRVTSWEQMGKLVLSNARGLSTREGSEPGHG